MLQTQAHDASEVERARGPDLRLLLPACIAWAVLAAALGMSAWSALVAAVGIAVTGAVGAVLAMRSGHDRAAALAGLSATVVVLVLAAFASHLGARRAGPVPALAAESAVVTVTATVRSDPRLLPADDERPTDSALVVMVVTEVRARGRVSTVRTPVLVLGDTSLMRLRWAETVHLRGKLTTADPGDDVEALLRLRGSPEVVAPSGPVFTLADHARERLRQAVANLPPDARGLVPAMVIGDRSLTPPELTDAMLATGLTHLSAVSGSNVSLSLMGVILLMRLTGVPRRARPFVGILAVAMFVVLARPDPSVVRAAVMGIVGLIGVSRSRRAAGAPALGASVIVLLVIDPWLARSYGFALSVLATAGLLLFARPWGEGLAARLPAILRPLAFAVAVPVAAQAACGPVIVLIQGGLPVYGVLANVLAAPLVAPVTLAGLATALVALGAVGSASLVAWCAAIPALLIAIVARSLATLPGGVIPWPDNATGAVLLGLVTCSVLVAGERLMQHVDRLGRRLRLLIATVAVLVWGALLVPLPERGGPGAWEVAACDVGQGDALVLATGPPGHAVLVDTGRDPRLVDRCLASLGVQVLDALVLTHYDGDHIDGLIGAVEGRRVDSIIVSGVLEGAGRPQAVNEIAAQRGTAVTPLVKGAALSWGNVGARVLNPTQTADGSANDGSLVLDVRTPSLRVLLLADVETDGSRAVLRAVAEESDSRAVDVVKVSHHGSAQVDGELYTKLRARLGLISVGEGNDYGHPAPAVLTQLARAGTTVWRTDEVGTVVVGTVVAETASRETGQASVAGPMTQPELWVRALRTR